MIAPAAGGRLGSPIPLKYRDYPHVIDSKNLGANAETAAMNVRASVPSMGWI